MELLEGFVSSILYSNDESAYKVMRVSSEAYDKPVVVTGYFPNIIESITYIFHGDYVDHPRYGIQFLVTHFEQLELTSEDAIVRYLSSPLFPKVGKGMATKIYQSLGEHTIELIRADKFVLESIKGMNAGLMQRIYEIIVDQNEHNEAIQFFLGHGMSLKDIAKITAVYKHRTLHIVQENPYRLIEDIEGIGFKKVDSFAYSMAFDDRHPYRLKAAVLYNLKRQCMATGDTYVTIETAMNVTNNTVALDPAQFMEMIMLLEAEEKVVIEGEKLFDQAIYHSEQTIAQHIKMFNALETPQLDASLIEAHIRDFEEIEQIKYDVKQKEAIETFLQSAISILTGGPGTGKTTVVKAITSIYSKMFPSKRLAIVAPTGRAAKRLQELTGVNAMTIHHLLKWDMHANKFEQNALNPIEYDVLIIDEFSMVDSLLFHHLLEASAFISKILMIGDDQQLPSVAPGNVLSDIIESDTVTVSKLNTIFRQSEQSGIIQLAHKIRNSEPILFDKEMLKDIAFNECSSINAFHYISKYVAKAIERGYVCDDIQILAPMYSGACGIDRLNEMLQHQFNPKAHDKREIKVGHKIFRVEDKMLQLKNRPDDDVYNGDIGKIVDIGYKTEEEDNTLTLYVDFDGVLVSYKPADFITLTHAYCMSIHKSQGNEFKIVMMPIVHEHSHMMTKKLLYTGITRAKQSLVLVGSKKKFEEVMAMQSERKRCTCLLLRLKT